MTNGLYRLRDDLDLKLLEALLEVVLFPLETEDMRVQFARLLGQLILVHSVNLERFDSLLHDRSLLRLQLLLRLFPLAFFLHARVQYHRQKCHITLEWHSVECISPLKPLIPQNCYC